MESVGFMDDLLDFASDIGEEDDEEEKPNKGLSSLPPNCSDPSSLNVLGPVDPSHSLAELAEEELEWLSNKDAFPAVETFIDILSGQPCSIPKHQNMVSVLEYSTSSSNSNKSTNISTLMSCCGSLKVPVRARSKRRRKRRYVLADIPIQQFWWSQQNNKIAKVETMITHSTIGRKCQHCGAEKTPQWRAGPLGHKTLCNACGVRYKSGRLVPEYRPACSPTFSSELHSNSHRKVMEMRRQKQMDMVVNAVDKG
ncbi:putative GATA transcription factor [Quillaja saponaria]|uniref:GATA transcription factor n=1 Tax=Quillaja saponaria TaxID=32244 RepID=A0AAD7LDT6_QUISA|nr:putative GATA transcription factor [Quillaja saponaria]KAJ7955547.1 putative GATA transcription factor [Quillaja saponaria]